MEVDARNSSDRDGTIASYEWSWGDGTSSASPTATHRYHAAGTYVIRLTVYDSQGLSDTSSRAIVAENLPPVARFTEFTDKLSLRVDASKSEDPEGAPLQFRWVWGDGNASGDGPTSSHKFQAKGHVTVTLTVLDPEGLSNSTSKQVIIPGLTPPQAKMDLIVNGMVLLASAAASTDPDGRIVSTSWDIAGTTLEGVVVQHSFNSSGNVTVELRVVDDDGLESRISSVAVVGASPSVDESLMTTNLEQDPGENTYARTTDSFLQLGLVAVGVLSLAVRRRRP